MAINTLKSTYDLAIIGGGIIGLASARQVLLRYPKLNVCVLEKEAELASHQSKRNSGVVHCGIYYKKNSMKSRLCVKGAEMVREYCLEKGLPLKQCGKMIVATRIDELETLHDLYRNAEIVGLEGVELISKESVIEKQPGCTRAIEAIWCPKTAIIDWQQVAHSYAKDFEQLGGKIFTNFTAYKCEPSESNTINIEKASVPPVTINAKSVVNCAGLFSDYFARTTGNLEHPKVVPFKGNYYMLSERLAKTIQTNVYPVPDPKVPFLGVHVTPRLDGSVLIGPTSLLTIGYENYDEKSPLKFSEMYHILIRSGVKNMLRKKEYFAAGVEELLRHAFKSRVVAEVRKFLPDVRAKDLIETGFCGIRAQVVEKDGGLVDDFLFETGSRREFSRILHLRNCPSPAATSSLAIAERVVNIVEERLL